LPKRSSVFPPNHQVALIAHLSRPSRGEIVYFAIDFGFPATWPGARIPAGADLYAAVLPAAEMAMGSGDVTVTVKDLGGNDLATGTLRIER